MLEGKNVNLRLVERDDLPLIAEWLNDPRFFSRAPFPQRSRTEMERQYDNLSPESKWFLVEKKDRGKIGFLYHSSERGLLEIGYALVPSERGKGYGTEAVSIIVDYLFLTRNVMRIQATTDIGNEASQRALEKNGFKREGIIRKAAFVRGQWQDEYVYSILREEWKQPKTLTKNK